MNIVIAYTMSRFPLVTETFILREMVALEDRGYTVEVYPLILEKGVKHKDASRFSSRVHYYPVFSFETFTAQLYWVFVRPYSYLRIWTQAILGNIRSLKFLSRAIVVVPKAACFARKMEKNGVKHIHAHYLTHPILTAYCIHQLTGISYSVTGHAHDIYVDRSMLGRKMSNACKIITISEYNRSLLAENYPAVKSKLEVVRCGVDLDKYPAQSQRNRTEKPFIVTIASFNEYKGHRYLIEALSILKRKNINFNAMFIGDGKLRADIEEQIRRNELAGEIRLVGAQPQHRVARLIRKATLVVQPSIIQKSGKMEGIPVCLMEALACEIPVIATEISGIPELVIPSRTGYLVPEKDAERLADTIEYALRNYGESKSMAQLGRRLVIEHYDLHKNTDQLCSVLEAVMRTKAHLCSSFSTDANP